MKTTTTIPQKLFAKASACGLVCIPSETGKHCIKPASADHNWQLVCQQEVWVLVIGGFPQIRFRYDEATQFIERLSRS
jgi:hypothetical protein